MTLPLHRPRRHRWRRLLSHDQRRLSGHFAFDPERIKLCRTSIGTASWLSPFGGVFGDPNAAFHMPCFTARVLAFPERCSELAQLRPERAIRL
jgi:hypothetical protein